MRAMSGDRFQEVQSPLSYRPRSSLPVEVLHWLAQRLAHLRPARRAGQGGTRRCRWRSGWTPWVRWCWTGCPTDAPPGWSGSARPRSAIAWTCSGRVGRAGAVPARRDVRGHPPRPARTAGGDDRGRRGGVRRWAGGPGATPGGWANQKVLDDAKRRTHTAQGVALSTIHGDLLWV